VCRRQRQQQQQRVHWAVTGPCLRHCVHGASIGGGGSGGGGKSAAALGPPPHRDGDGGGGGQRRRWAVPWVAHSPPRWAVAAACGLLVCDWVVFGVCVAPPPPPPVCSPFLRIGPPRNGVGRGGA
jgi:hypothetical protein